MSGGGGVRWCQVGVGLGGVRWGWVRWSQVEVGLGDVRWGWVRSKRQAHYIKAGESMPLTTYPVKYLKLHECVETLAQK